MTKKTVLLGVALLGLFVVLAGCTPGMVNFGASANIPLVKSVKTSQLHLLGPQRAATTSVSGQNVTTDQSVPFGGILMFTGSICGGSGDWGDQTWVHITGIQAGTPFVAVLDGWNPNSDFDLGFWKDGDWTSNPPGWSSGPTAHEKISDVSGSNNWIWVGAYAGCGGYNLEVIAPVPVSLVQEAIDPSNSSNYHVWFSVTEAEAISIAEGIGMAVICSSGVGCVVLAAVSSFALEKMMEGSSVLQSQLWDVYTLNDPINTFFGKAPIVILPSGSPAPQSLKARHG